MLNLQQQPMRLCAGIGRREVLRAGGLSALGLSLPMLQQTQLLAENSGATAISFGKAKACIVLFLMGGPPQHSTFDPKPLAPLEVRGEGELSLVKVF